MIHRKKPIKPVFAILVGAVLLGTGVFLTAASCASAPPAEPAVDTPTTEELAVMKAEEERSARFKADPTGNDTGMTVISKVNRDFKYKTSYMIISKSGTVVVTDPYRIPALIEADLIVTTHGDDDHNDPAFYKRSSARRSLYKPESFTFKDVAVTGIPSSHQGDEFDPANPSNMIYLVEVDGLRIAVMGDICQSRLSDAQLAALGRVDVAFMIMFDAPQYGYTMDRSLAVLSQLKPRYVFPTHTSTRIVDLIGAAMGGVVHADYRFAIDATKLGTGPGEVVILAPLPD